MSIINATLSKRCPKIVKNLNCRLCVRLYNKYTLLSALDNSRILRKLNLSGHFDHLMKRLSSRRYRVDSKGHPVELEPLGPSIPACKTRGTVRRDVINITLRPIRLGILGLRNDT